MKYWGRLEQRTKQVFDLLKHAAHERCRSKSNEGDGATRYSRKELDKMKKSLVAVEDILSRGNESKMNDALSHIYEPFSAVINDRAKMRKLWDQREKDGLFKSMNFEYRPIEVPFKFNVQAGGNQGSEKNQLKDFGESPLDGAEKDLKRMSSIIMKLGSAFKSQSPSDLPDIGTVPDDVNTVKSNSNQQESKSHNEESTQLCTVIDPTDHHKDMEWDGWKKYDFGLEIQSPWTSLILDGKKTIETRLYNLPDGLLGKRILILESKAGEARVSGLSNTIDGKEISESVKVVGWAVFNKVVIYRYRSKFEADEKKHLVIKNSDYAWKEDTEVVYGWVVSKKGKFQHNPPSIQSLTRRMRSIFQYV